ncbi:MAG TPA: putative glycoside hydrolase [Candidatus Paceibacterota bacterium]|nr:putative glycoside hydrolase [Candidatus Paceibacterota bacterium]
MKLLPFIALPALLLLAGISAFPYLTPISYEAAAVQVAETVATSTPPKPPPAKHLPSPEPLKAIYMSQCVSGTPSIRNNLVKLVEDTELNAIIIDIRDFTGKISFPTDNPLLKDSVSDACGAKDMKEFIATLHEKGIFVIGRITVFQNPYYTKQHPEQAVQRKSGGVWKDNKGLAFVDVGAKPYWDHVVELGKISYELGFDELNFDYVRYPSDGPMAEADYTWSRGKSKVVMLEEFFKYLSDALRPTGAVLSADLFGMTATNVDDLNIGQVLERALPYFDYIYPMVYPSHYPPGFNGYKNVNANAYNIVQFSMKRAADRAAATTTIVAALTHTPIASTSPQLYAKPAYDRKKMRPWLQSFDYPVPYTPAMVEEQIKATYDAGLTSWLFWDAANKYTSLRQVLKKE